MQTAFSHIVLTRYSQSFEDVATDTLAYILNTHQTAMQGMMWFLRNISPDIGDLCFRTQNTDGGIRPDMLGISGFDTKVYIENKFWAGLTDNQPTSYLNELKKYKQPTILMMIVPAQREHTMIVELIRRMEQDEIEFEIMENRPKGVVFWAKTQIGPDLVLTSWLRLIDILETKSENDQSAKRDLNLLRSLCEAAKINEFIPLSSEEINNQMTPALIIELGKIIRESVNKGVAEGFINRKRLNESSSFDGMGRYIKLFNQKGVGIWFGIDYSLWREFGEPLWFKFLNDNFGHANLVEPILKHTISKRNYIKKLNNGDVALSIHLETRVEKDRVIESIIEQMRDVACKLENIIKT